MNKKLVTCKVCGKEIAKSAKVCPHCGAKLKKGHPIIGGILIVLGLSLVVSGLTGGASTTPTQAVKEIASANIELVGNESDISIKKDMFAWYFEGTIVNNKTTDLSYAQIVINLYDSDGALLGTAVDNINNLKAGGKWKFNAMTLLTSDQLEQVESWEVSEITGF